MNESTKPPLLRRLVKALDVLPPIPRITPVQPTPRLVAFIGILLLLSMFIAMRTVREPSSWPALLAGSAAFGLLEFHNVPVIAGVGYVWSLSPSLRLAMAILFGPTGALACLTGSLADAVRFRIGWVRLMFNASTNFLCGFAVWKSYTSIATAPVIDGRTVGAGLIAGLADFAVNQSLIAAVFYVSGTGNPRVFVKGVLWFLPFNLGYGAFAATYPVLYARGGPLAFLLLLVPIGLVQGTFVVLARAAYAHDQAEDRRHEENVQQERDKAELAQRAEQASTRERERIANDLHDSVVQDLFGARFKLGQLRAKSLPPDVLAELEETEETTRQAMADLRHLMIEIAPRELTSDDMPEALQGPLRRLEKQGVANHVDWPKSLPLAEDHAKLAYRIIREGLRNIAKHAEASNVYISAAVVDDAVTVILKDDGVGFAPEVLRQRRKEGHFGLSHLPQTAADGGGELTVESVQGKGTTLTLRLPATGLPTKV